MKIINTIFYSNNIEKTKESYIQLGFELDVEKSKDNFVSFKTEVNGLFFSISKADSNWKKPGSQSIVFAVDNLEWFYNKTKELGFEIVKDIHESGYGKTFTCHDFDGNKLMIASNTNC